MRKTGKARACGVRNRMVHFNHAVCDEELHKHRLLARLTSRTRRRTGCRSGRSALENATHVSWQCRMLVSWQCRAPAGRGVRSSGPCSVPPLQCPRWSGLRSGPTQELRTRIPGGLRTMLQERPVVFRQVFGGGRAASQSAGSGFSSLTRGRLGDGHRCPLVGVAAIAWRARAR